MTISTDRPIRPASSGHWVYIIRYGKSGIVKIGTTTRPKHRLSCLRSTSIEPLEVLATFRGGRELEKRLHELFAEQRTRNEFFQHDDLLDHFLRNIENGQLPSNGQLPDAIARVEELKEWRKKSLRERSAIGRQRRERERRATIIPIYPHDWNDARLEANRQKEQQQKAIK